MTFCYALHACAAACQFLSPIRFPMIFTWEQKKLKWEEKIHSILVCECVFRRVCFHLDALFVCYIVILWMPFNFWHSTGQCDPKNLFLKHFIKSFSYFNSNDFLFYYYHFCFFDSFCSRSFCILH